MTLLRKIDEMTRRRLAFVICTVAVLSFHNSFSQSKVDSLTNRIEVLEDYKTNIQQLYNISAAQLKTYVDQQIDQKVKDTEEQKRTLNLLLYFGVPATLMGLIVVYFGAIGRAKKLIISRIETIVEHKREDLIKLIETQEYDTKLKKSKKILVLSANEDCQEITKKLFRKFGFTEVKFRVVQSYQEFNDYDLIVFNDYDKSFSQPLISEFIQNAKGDEVGFVAYTTNNLQRDPKLNFSNSPFTLYHNILSTLKFNEILKISISDYLNSNDE